MSERIIDIIKKRLKHAEKMMEEVPSYEQYTYWFVKAKTLKEILEALGEPST
jgi:uncharacterized short protein YbdD (DUF466 family)